MFRGTTLDGTTHDRWINGDEALGSFNPDPSDVDRLTFTEESVLDDEFNSIYSADRFPLVIDDHFGDGLLIQALPERN
jgi:hypothetical protein